MKNRDGKFSVKAFLNPITLVVGAILFVGLVLISLAILFLGRKPAPTTAATPVATLIAAPTVTSTAIGPTTIPTPTPTTIFFLPEGVIGVGAYVQVTGTGGAGLRMRSDPGLNSTVNFTAMEAEVFLVIGGPEEADGYTWWLLEAPYDQTRTGWSASDFLSALSEQSDE